MSPRARAFPGWLLLLLIAPLAAFQVYDFRWGVVSPDTVAQWGQALANSYDDWHPPATAWLWRQLMPLGQGTAPILIFDVALYWAGIALIADTLRRRGHPYAMFIVLLCACLPIPFGQVGAILKDPLLAILCLVAAGLLHAADGRRRSLAFPIALVLLLFASATRVNAVFATAPLLAAWFAGRGPSRTAAAFIACLAILGAGGWAIDNVALHPRHAQPIYSLVNFDLAGIAAHGGAHAYPNLDPATEQAVVARCYDPRQYNRTYLPVCDGVEDALAEYAERTHRSPLSIWWQAVSRAPHAYLRHRIAHMNQNQRFWVADVPDDAVYIMTTPNAYGIAFHPAPIARLISRAARITALSPLGRPATWLAVALGLLIVAPGLPSRRFVTAAAGSALLYGAAYAVISVAPDLRYNLWTMLGATMALIVACADMPTLGSSAWRGPRFALACTIVAATIAAEFAAMLV